MVSEMDVWDYFGAHNRLVGYCTSDRVDGLASISKKCSAQVSFS